MAKCISLGKYSRHFIYIIFFVIISLLNNSLFSINYYQAFNEIRLIPRNSYSDFEFIRQILSYYFGTSIIAFIFSIKEKKNSEKEKIKKTKKQKESSSRNPSSSIVFIHEDSKEKQKKKISLFPILAIIFGWILQEQLIEKYNRTLSHLDFWMLELIVICYLNSRMFHLEIYKHQKLVLIFSLIPIIFKIFTIIFVFIGEKQAIDEKPIYVKHWYWIPLGLLIYFPLITLKAYIIIKIKWLMDLKYISANKILMAYGFIGGIFYSIFAILSSFSYFSSKEENLEYIFISKNNSFSKYFTTNPDSFVDIIYEIITNILVMITTYFIKYNYMMILKYLTPVHIIFLTPIYYFFFKLTLLIYNVFYCNIKKNFDKFFDTNSMDYLYANFFLDISGDIFSFLGFLVYLEIIVLNCFQLNYNIREEIITRSTLELSNIDNDVMDDDNLNDSLIEEDNNEDLNKKDSENNLNNVKDKGKK